MARSAASRTALCLAAAACLLGGAAAANLMGSATQGELQLSCTTPQTCGTLQNLVFEGYYFAANQSASVATCMCMDGRRVRAAGAPSDPSIDFQQPDGPLMSRGCWANMTWSLAAPFVAACRLDALAGGVCATSCATRLAPFNSDCFHSVLSEDYFLYAPDQQAPDATIIAAFYNACFPPAGAQPAAPAVDAPQQQKAPALSAAGAGMGAASSSAQAGSGVWGLVAALAAAALLAA